MQKLVVPALVLATVALSSSNLLPVVMNELNNPLDYKYQENDNTYSSKQNRKLNAILFNLDVSPDTDKAANYVEDNEEFRSMSKDDNYDMKGFRKEQWHNYPRQLDRLNRYFYQHQNADKRNLDPDDHESNYEPDLNQEDVDNSLTNEYVPEYAPEYEPDTSTLNNEEDLAAAVINPLLILRIQLACSNKAPNQAIHLLPTESQTLENSYKENSILNELNPEPNQIKVKREDRVNSEDVDRTHETVENPRNKRIFALFSRLQSLSPKGHQLHHRRHMYAMYGPPDSDGNGGGVLTAETRATFMRPPGSPLRWG